MPTSLNYFLLMTRASHVGSLMQLLVRPDVKQNTPLGFQECYFTV